MISEYTEDTMHVIHVKQIKQKIILYDEITTQLWCSQGQSSPDYHDITSSMAPVESLCPATLMTSSLLAMTYTQPSLSLKPASIVSQYPYSQKRSKITVGNILVVPVQRKTRKNHGSTMAETMFHYSQKHSTKQSKNNVPLQ